MGSDSKPPQPRPAPAPPPPPRPVTPRPPSKAIPAAGDKPPPIPRPRPRPGMTLPISGTRTPLPSLTAATVEGAGAGPLSRRAGCWEGRPALRGFTLPQPPEFQIGVARALNVSLHRRGR